MYTVKPGTHSVELGAYLWHLILRSLMAERAECARLGLEGTCADLDRTISKIQEQVCE